MSGNFGPTRKQQSELTRHRATKMWKKALCALTGETFLVLLYVQLKRICSAGSASTSHRTSIECILIEPTDVCSVPGLQRGASEKVKRANTAENEMEEKRIDSRQLG